MADRRYNSVQGISLTALASLVVGVAAFVIVFFLLFLLLNNLSPITLSAGALTISQDLLRIVVIWPGIGFLPALAGIMAGFAATPENGQDDRSRTCKWICRLDHAGRADHSSCCGANHLRLAVDRSL
jgi:hypothetical protein